MYRMCIVMIWAQVSAKPVFCTLKPAVGGVDHETLALHI